MRLVPINCIKPGSFLSRTIYDDKGRVLLAKGVPLSGPVLNKIKLHGILSLYIQDEYSDHEIEDVIQPELRQKAIHSVKSYFQFSNYNKIEVRNTARNNEYLKRQDEHVQSLKALAENIVEEILSQRNIMINLVDIKSMDNYTYAHCVNVAILSLVLGVEWGLNKKQLLDLAMGAMLHDIGKVFVPQDILNKKGKLSEEEFQKIQEHPRLGYEYLKKIYDVNAFARGVVLQHHEKIDGSGYPNGLEAEEMHTLSKIVAIADVYDALVSDRPYRMGLSPNEAIEYIMGLADRHFDYWMVKAFIGKIIPYPIGTLVRMSNGCIGIIEAITPYFPLRPVIGVVVGNRDYYKGDRIDLYENNNIVIEGIQYEDPNEEDNEKAYAY